MRLPRRTPASLGLDARRLRLARRHVEIGLGEGIYDAAVLAVARHGAMAMHEAFGTIEGHPTSRDALFDLASLTKTFCATAMLRLAEDGVLSLSDTVADWVAEAARAELGCATLRQLATHVSGLPAWKPLYDPTPGKEAMLRAILETPLANAPGTVYEYSDLGYILLGEVASRASGQPLEDLIQSTVTGPIGADEVGYLPSLNAERLIAPTANCPMRPGEVLRGVVHDANAHAYGGVAGHAGLFGDADGLALLGSALAGDGFVLGKRLVGRPALRLARTNQLAPEVGGHTIGWFCNPNPMCPFGDLAGPDAFGHTGFTGTMVVCEPSAGVVAVLLTNRVLNPADNNGIKRVRRQVVHAVASAVRQ